MSDTNRTRISIVEEDANAPGVIPTSPVMEILRTTGPTLSSSPTTVISNELRDDRQITDLIVVGIEAGGGLPMEASYGALTTLIRGGMMNEFLFAPVRSNVGSTRISAVSGTQYTIVAPDSPATDKSSGTFAEGHLIRASGFGVAGNNGLKRVTAATGTTINAAGLAVEASPPATSRIKVVGLQGAAGDLAAVTAGGNGLTSVLLDFTTIVGLRAGLWVKIGGSAAGDRFNTTGCNGWARISAVAANKISFDIVPDGFVADAGTGKTLMVFFGDVIRNGTTRRSYGVQLSYLDLDTPEFDWYTGMHVNQITFSGDSEAILQFTADMLGYTVLNGTSNVSGITYVDAPTNRVMNTSTNVGELREGGAILDDANLIASFSVTLNNNLRRRPAIGRFGTWRMGLGRAMVEGSISTYYSSNAIRTKLLNGTATSLNMQFTDPDGGKNMILDLPWIKFNDGTPTTPGVDTDRMFDPNFTGLRHPTLGYTIQVQLTEEFQ